MTRIVNHPLLKKEIHLLLPAWVLAFLLAVAPPWLYAHQFLGHKANDSFTPFAPVWFGVVLLCASSFGREFSLGTFSGLLALPFPRRQFWLAKAGVLMLALATVLGANVLAGLHDFTTMIDAPTAAWLGVFLLAAMAGGFWLALLVRQMVAVVWLVALVPGLLCVPVLLGLSRFGTSDHVVEVTLYTLLFTYSVAGIAGSWLIFCRAQDAPWSGGAINLPDWMSASISLPAAAEATAPRTAVQALIRKEFQLNQVPLLGMGVLFLLHLGVVLLRYLHRNPDPADHLWIDLNSALGAFGSVWIIAPLIIGCTSVAEERKLGTLAGQLCQPVTARRQFLVKLGFTLGVGGLLSALFCLTAEGIGRSLGLNGHGMVAEEVLVITAGLLAVALIAFYASTLTRNLLQALPAAVGTALGIGLVLQLFYGSSFFNFMATDFVFWSHLLPCFIFAGLLPLTLAWLAYQNFRCLPESGRLWRRNVATLAALILFSGVAGSAIYHRAWELFTPFEPAPGAARWAPGQQPVVMRTSPGNDLLVALPDGRLWQGWIGDGQQFMQDSLVPRNLSEALTFPPAPRLSFGQFLPGSNWVSLSIGGVGVNVRRDVPAGAEPHYFIDGNNYARPETVGVQANGTLWVSVQPIVPDAIIAGLVFCNTNALVQYGTETDWREVAADGASVLLLKTDGTLWRWGDPRIPKPGSRAASAALPLLRNTAPRQIGTSADWQGLTHEVGPGVQKADGTIWSIRSNAKTGVDEIKHSPKLEQWAREQQRHPAGNYAAGANFMQRAEIHPDGTLWLKFTTPLPVQMGRDNDWRAVALGMDTLVALKQDGTLWQWGGRPGYIGGGPDYLGTPHRLGTRQDWVALAQIQEGAVSVGGDGRLCLWRINEYWPVSPQKLIAPSRKPVSLGNLFAGQ